MDGGNGALGMVATQRLRTHARRKAQAGVGHRTVTMRGRDREGGTAVEHGRGRSHGARRSEARQSHGGSHVLACVVANDGSVAMTGAEEARGEAELHAVVKPYQRGQWRGRGWGSAMAMVHRGHGDPRTLTRMRDGLSYSRCTAATAGREKGSDRGAGTRGTVAQKH